MSRSQPLRPSARRPRDSEATRGALLSAAIAEFAEKGLAGGRVEEIAARAGVNKQLVYHHFGSKDELYAAALEQAYAWIREQERTLDLSQAPPVRAMERLIGFSFDYLQDHPEFVALVADRAAAQHISGSPALRTMHSPLIELLRETLARGAEDGVFRPDLDPVDVYISIAALSYFYFSNRHTLSAIFDRDLGDPAAIAARRRHIVSFALAALRL